MPNIFPTRLVDSVNGQIGNVKISVLKSSTLEGSTLTLYDQENNEIDNVVLTTENIQGLDELLGNISTNTRVRTIEVLNKNLETKDAAGVAKHLNEVGFYKAGKETIIINTLDFFDPVITITFPEEGDNTLSPTFFSFETNSATTEITRAEVVGRNVTIDFYIE